MSENFARLIWQSIPLSPRLLGLLHKLVRVILYIVLDDQVVRRLVDAASPRIQPRRISIMTHGGAFGVAECFLAFDSVWLGGCGWPQLRPQLKVLAIEEALEVLAVLSLDVVVVQTVHIVYIFLHISASIGCLGRLSAIAIGRLCVLPPALSRVSTLQSSLE